MFLHLRDKWFRFNSSIVVLDAAALKSLELCLIGDGFQK